MTADTDTEIWEAEQPVATNDQPQAATEASGSDAPEQANSWSEDDIAGLKDTLAGQGNIDMLLDVDLKLTVELGRARLKIRDVLNLSTGSVIELLRMTSEPVDILVNDALLATGEVVVVDDHFAVKITKLLDRIERLKRVV